MPLRYHATEPWPVRPAEQLQRWLFASARRHRGVRLDMIRIEEVCTNAASRARDGNPVPAELAGAEYDKYASRRLATVPNAYRVAVAGFITAAAVNPTYLSLSRLFSRNYSNEQLHKWHAHSFHNRT